MSALCRGLMILLTALTVAACQEDGPQASASENGVVVPELVAAEQTLCERTGGRWAPRTGDVLFVCYRDLSDANKQCRTSNDCQGMCLARSRTCSPIEPFLGCHETLSSAGLPATVCIQ
ncbi:MAG: hypothetical protein GKR98_00945 [Boseongicola sp.]|nr:MAG: hypothetical protein GKR98_00945 [Boseongicola sp.]